MRNRHAEEALVDLEEALVVVEEALVDLEEGLAVEGEGLVDLEEGLAEAEEVLAVEGEVFLDLERETEDLAVAVCTVVLDAAHISGLELDMVALLVSLHGHVIEIIIIMIITELYLLHEKYANKVCCFNTQQTSSLRKSKEFLNCRDALFKIVILYIAGYCSIKVF
jgi:hypothetical protein